MTRDDEKNIGKIMELFNSLSEGGKDEMISELIESEDFMRRVLSLLIESDGQLDDSSNTGGYVDFLKKVRE